MEMARLGLDVHLGGPSAISEGAIARVLMELDMNKQRVQEIREKGKALIDGPWGISDC